MMSCKDAVIVENLKKSYKILDTPRAQLLNLLGLDINRKQVLKGLTFRIEKGERVGILGINGAGKSTLLNIIAGMSKPDSGTVEVNGEIGAILELGAGFHPDLTGRQNAEMVLALKGVSKSLLAGYIDQVCEFSELGSDLDSKIRTYSSGMLVRLAFATACAVKPDLFIVDEALAVGDARFQQKCYDFLLNSMMDGTLLLISHDMSAISAICDRVIILNGGEIYFDGSPAEGIISYNRLSQNRSGVELNEVGLNDFDARKSGPRDIDIVSAKLSVSGNRVSAISGGDVVTIGMKLKNQLEPCGVVVGFTVLNLRGQKVFGQTSHGYGQLIAEHTTEIEMTFKWPSLAPGAYTVTIGVGKGDHEGIQTIQCWINDCFEIESVLSEMSHGIFNIALDSLSFNGRNMNATKNAEGPLE